MIVTWLLYSALVGVLCAAAAYAGGHFFRLLRLPERWVWLAGIVAVLALSVSALVRLIQPSVEDGAANAMHAVPLIADDGAVQTGLIESLLAPVRSSIDAGRDAIDTMFGALMNLVPRAEAGTLAERLAALLSVTTTIVLLLVLTLTMRRLRRLRSGWRSHRIGNESVLVSSGTGPALVGVLHPAIVVPSWLLLQPTEQQDLVVRHEREHQRAGDHVMLLCACLAACLLPLNPALWWMLRRLHLAVELDCNARVLGAGAGTRLYGTLLLDMACRLPTRTRVAPAIVASRTHLERRLLAMTDRNRSPRPLRAAVAGLLAVVPGLVACATELPSAARIDEMDVTVAREEALRAGLLTEGTPLYIVDGVVVRDTVIREIVADDIESVQVVRGERARTLYGQRAEDGVIIVDTRAGEPGTVERIEGVSVLPRVGTPEQRARELRELVVTGHPIQEDKPTELRAEDMRVEMRAAVEQPQALIVLDGVVMPATWKVDRLSPDAIESVEVVKSVRARELYGARGANGVIRITTKQKQN